MRYPWVLGCVVLAGVCLVAGPPTALAASSFGFIDTPDGFAYEVIGTDNRDNLVVSTDPGSSDLEIRFETSDAGGIWSSFEAEITPADILQEAADRGFTVDAFAGLLIELKDGDDISHADGGGVFGILPGAEVVPFAVMDPLVGTPMDLDGGPGDDRLLGSDDDDVIRGGAGDDMIDGFRGRDSLNGDEGNDTLFGGAGDADDILNGGAGDDFLDGERGSDILLGGPGRDVIRGEYDPGGSPGAGTGGLVDLVTGGLRGGEGGDSFEILGAEGTADEIDGRAELRSALNFSDYDGGIDSFLSVPPSGGAGGPYFVRDGGPLQLNAVRPAGKSPVTYEWDLDNDGMFDDATGVNPLVDLSNIATYFPDPFLTYQVRVRVTDPAISQTTIASAEVRNAGAPYITITDVRAPEGDAGERGFTFTVNLSGPAPERVTLDFVVEEGAPAAGLIGPLGEETSSEEAEALRAAGLLVHQDGSLPHPGDELVSFHVPICDFWHWHRWDLDFYVGCGHSLAYAVGPGPDPASGPSDFVRLEGAAAILPGESSATITVPVLGDRLLEPDETFSVTLRNPSVGTIVDGLGVGTIANDDVNASPGPGAGFVGLPGQFAYKIAGTPFSDSVTVWTDGTTQDTRFFVEWIRVGGEWNHLEGSFSDADVVQEAQNRGMTPDDFAGIFAKLDEGDDTFRADGSGSIGVLPGATMGPIRITAALSGEALKVFGNDGDDNLFGSEDDDILIGGGGNDTIFGRDGDDTLLGEEGSDTIVGGPGNDRISGGAGDDTLLGSGLASRDMLDGGDGDDFLDGGRGGDLIAGAGGNDLVLAEYSGGGAPNSGSGELADVLQVFGLFGDEGRDEFRIRGTSGVIDRFDVLAELDAALSFGRTDVDAANDLLAFDPAPNGPAVTGLRRLPSHDLLIEWNGTGLRTAANPGGPFTTLAEEEPGTTIQPIDEIDALFLSAE